MTHVTWYMYGYKIDFFSTWVIYFSSGRGSFLVLSATRHAGAPTWLTFGPRPRSMARALGVQSREN